MGTRSLFRNRSINSGTSIVHNGTGKIKFSGTTGIFTGINQPALPAISPITVAIANPTAALGDTGRVQARIDAPTGKLLKAATDYSLVVNATITP